MLTWGNRVGLDHSSHKGLVEYPRMQRNLCCYRYGDEGPPKERSDPPGERRPHTLLDR